ncbi:MAG: hypothetical protein D6732_04665, partial [Methanobacteriota archaeon]
KEKGKIILRFPQGAGTLHVSLITLHSQAKGVKGRSDSHSDIRNSSLPTPPPTIPSFHPSPFHPSPLYHSPLTIHHSQLTIDH